MKHKVLMAGRPPYIFAGSFIYGSDEDLATKNWHTKDLRPLGFLTFLRVLL